MTVRFSTRGWLALSMLVGVSTVPAAPSADARWLDMQSRIQYAYYTEDSRALDEVTQTLASEEEGASPLHDYYRGLAAYRLALLSAPRDRSKAEKSAQVCVSSIDSDLKKDADSVEALALGSACLRLLSSLSSLGSPLSSVRGGHEMSRALKLAPNNPRVLMLDGLADYDHSASKAGALGKLQKAVAAFELERHQVERAPSWGAPEAYAYLARSYLDRGDAIAARSALEHALLLVPDFAYAHRLLSRITTG